MKQLQGFDRAKLVNLKVANALGDMVAQGLEEADLDRFMGTRSKLLGDFVLGPLVKLQHGEGALNNGDGQASQTCDFDAVAAVSFAGLDFAQENDAVACLLDRDAEITDTIELVGKFGELVIMGGEERLRASALVDELDHRPGKGEAIVRGGASADFVEDDKAARRGRVEDDGCFGHFDHEGRSTASQIVRRSDAGENAIDQGKRCSVGRDEGAHLGEYGDECSLAEVGGLAAHIRACDEGDEVSVRVKVKVVRNEAAGIATGFVTELLDHRMAASNDPHSAVVGEGRARVTVGRSDFGQGGRYIETGDGRCRGTNALRVIGGEPADFAEEILFQRQDLLLGVQNLALVILELGSGETLGVDQGLLALVIGRSEMQVGFRDFDVVAKDVVETDFQRLYACACALASFNLSDVLPAVLAEIAEFIELRIVAGADRAPVADVNGRGIGDCMKNAVANLGQLIKLAGQLAEPDGGQGGNDLLECGNFLERLSEGEELTRTGGTDGDFREQALHVEDIC